MELQDKIALVGALRGLHEACVARIEADPDAPEIDLDSCLADAMEEHYLFLYDMGNAVLDIWEKSTDKESVEELFYTFIGCDFEHFITVSEQMLSKALELTKEQ